MAGENCNFSSRCLPYTTLNNQPSPGLQILEICQQKTPFFPILCTEFWRTLCMYILIFPNYFSCTLTLLLLCCTGGHPVYAGWAGGGRVPVQAGEWEPGPSAQQEERAGRQLGRYTQGPQLTSATGHIPRWDTANVAFRSEIWIVSVWVLSIFLSTKTLSTYQGCWSESAFIYFPGSGSAFNMWIRTGGKNRKIILKNND